MRIARLSAALLFYTLASCSDSRVADDEKEQQDELDEVENSDAGDDEVAAARDGAASRRDAEAKADTSTPRTDTDASQQTSRRDGGTTPAASDAGAEPRDAASADAASASTLKRFSFFMTSLKAMRELAGNQAGFGGDLRFGETGDGAGLRGADKICTTIAEKSMPGAGAKGWRAFLSATKGGEGGGPVHAIDRIGSGPWYDRVERVVALTKADIAQARPASADALIKNDLPNEEGVPNHNPDGTGEVDNHHVLTGSNGMGQLYANNPAVTCSDWTKSARDTADAPRVGLSWPRRGGGGGGGAGSQHWLSAMDESGCAPEVGIIEMGPPNQANPTVGSGGGYGAIYCFALMP